MIFDMRSSTLIMRRDSLLKEIFPIGNFIIPVEITKNSFKCGVGWGVGGGGVVHS